MMLQPPQAWEAYQRHRDEIAEMLDPRCYSVAWLDMEILQGRALAIGNDRAVIVVTVKHYPAGATELHGLVAAGELEGILELIDEAVKSATQEGMTFAAISSRPGWVKVLKGRGFHVHQIEVRRELQ